MRVILSHPYSGALFWWFEQEREHPMSKDPQHPYYASLFGDVSAHLDVALACTVVYEEIVIPTADAAYPGYGELQNLSASELGLEVCSWDRIDEARELSSPLYEGAWRDDPVLREVLEGSSDTDVFLELEYATADIILAREYEVPVLCSDGRRRIVQRLLEIGLVPGAATAGDDLGNGKSLPHLVDTYAQVTGLTFDASDYRRLVELKQADELRPYATSFQRALNDPRLETTDDLYESIAEAMASARLAQNVTGAFEAAGGILDVVGMIPAIGTVAGAAGRGAKAGAAAAKRAEKKARWYEFSQALAGTQVRLSLESELKRRGLIS